MKQRQQPHGFPGVTKKRWLDLAVLWCACSFAEVRPWSWWFHTLQDAVCSCLRGHTRRKSRSAGSRFSQRIGLSCPCGADENLNVKSQRSLFHRSKKKKWDGICPPTIMSAGSDSLHLLEGGEKKHLKICFMCSSDGKRQLFLFLFFPPASRLIRVVGLGTENVWVNITEWDWVCAACCVSTAHKHVPYVHFVPYEARETNFLRAAVTESLCGEAVSQQALKETCWLNQQVAPRLQRLGNLGQLRWNGSTTRLARQRRKPKELVGI